MMPVLNFPNIFKSCENLSANDVYYRHDRNKLSKAIDELLVRTLKQAVKFLENFTACLLSFISYAQPIYRLDNQQSIWWLCRFSQKSHIGVSLYD